MHIDRQRLETSDDDVEADVELLAANEQGRVHVALYNIKLGTLPAGILLVIWVLGISPVGAAIVPSRRRSPLLELRQLLHEEDARTLGSTDRLHDPRRPRVLLEFLDKHVVLHGHNKCHGADVVLLRLIQIPLLLTSTAHPLHVLYQQVFPRQFVMIQEVIHVLMRI